MAYRKIAIGLINKEIVKEKIDLKLKHDTIIFK